MPQFATVNTDFMWLSVPIVCAATGPSLDFEQANYIRKVHERGLCQIIAISDNYKLFPDAEIVYSTDFSWWSWYYEAVIKSCHGRLVTPNAAACLKYKKLEYIEGIKTHKGFSFKKGAIHLGRNSGFAAINLAILEGAKEIILVGYDMRKHDLKHDAKTKTAGLLHWFGDHPNQGCTPNFNGWIEKYQETTSQISKMGLKIINCTPKSALTCYPTGALEETLLC